MISRFRSFTTTAAVVAVLSLLHVSLSVALAAPIVPQRYTGRVHTRPNQTITVNGNPTGGGTTILSNSEVVTGDQVPATITLGSLGCVDLAPNTRIRLEFGERFIKVMLIHGCAIVRNRQGTYGEINTRHGKALSNDLGRKEESNLDTCAPEGAPGAIINQGAAANAGAGVHVCDGDEGAPLVFIWLGVGAAAAATAIAIGAGGDDRGEPISG